ncbi:hypothetical protein DFH06DRAFT_1327627 [Mycena polygramma]|nr:hypothetical protein DFH06DRAFT_1327627 [Mycena polygramma]
MSPLNRTCTYAHARPTKPRAMRAHLLTNRGPLDRWIGSTDIMADPYVSMYAPLADDDVRCQLFVALLEGMNGPVYQLWLVVYGAHVGTTEALKLGFYRGVPADHDAPLWTRRLPLFKLIRFTQPRAFIVRLVAGMTNIQFLKPASPNALVGTRCCLTRLPSEMLPSDRLESGREAKI